MSSVPKNTRKHENKPETSIKHNFLVRYDTFRGFETGKRTSILYQHTISSVNVFIWLTPSFPSSTPSTPPLSAIQLVESGATKQQGVVKRLTHDYGFLQSLSCPDTIYFNTCHVLPVKEGGPERLRVGSQVRLPVFTFLVFLCILVRFLCSSLLLSYLI